MKSVDVNLDGVNNEVFPDAGGPAPTSLVRFLHRRGALFELLKGPSVLHFVRVDEERIGPGEGEQFGEPSRTFELYHILLVRKGGGSALHVNRHAQSMNVGMFCW